jgi:uncharacterized membrane protein (UPF0182 family)
LVFGPQQVVNRINQDAEISRQTSLWDQRGSKAEFGTLLVVPIEESLIYVRPLYLRSEGGRIPELKRVIVAHENQIVMEPSLREAIDALFPAGVPEPSAEPDKPAPAPSAAASAGDTPAEEERATDTSRSLEQRALHHFERAVSAQRAGDWASYGEQLREMEAVLRDMQPGGRKAQPAASRTNETPTK